jgi:hypothetical protein
MFTQNVIYVPLINTQRLIKDSSTYVDFGLSGINTVDTYC